MTHNNSSGNYGKHNIPVHLSEVGKVSMDVTVNAYYLQVQ